MSFQWHLQKKTLFAVGSGKYYDAEETDKRFERRGSWTGFTMTLRQSLSRTESNQEKLHIILKPC
jgi:hypothetical protein